MAPARVPPCHGWVAAATLALLTLATTDTGAATADLAALGRGPVVGEPSTCVTPDDLDSIIPAAPLSAIALAGGDTLLVRWAQQGWGLLWLSRDGRRLHRVVAEVPTGRISGAVRLPDGRVLVPAEEGLFLFDGDRGLRRIATCEQTGAALLILGRDGDALKFFDGSLLLAGERGLLRVEPEGRVERWGELPPGTSAFEVVGGQAVLVSGVFGHTLMTRDGQAQAIATGTVARSHVVVRGSRPGRRSAPSRGEVFAQEALGIVPPPLTGIAIMDANGRTTWARVPDDVALLSHPIELADGRIFWLTDRGLLQQRDDGSFKVQSLAVRLACQREVNAAAMPFLHELVDGLTLVLARGVLFTIDRMDRVAPILNPMSCTRTLGERDVAATNDGLVYFVNDDVLHRADAHGRTVAITATTATGTIYSLNAYGADVLVSTQEGLFQVRKGRSLDRVVQRGRSVHALYEPDIDGRPLICVDNTLLHRLDPQGVLHPLRAADEVHHCGVTRAGTAALLIRRDEASHLLITRDDRAITVPGARVWPVAQLRDGSAILLTMPAQRDGNAWTIAPDEEESIPHALLRAAPDGGIEPVAFGGPEVTVGRPRDPTWQERAQVRAIHFTSATRGWAIMGRRGILSSTLDAGAQWRGVIANGASIQGLVSLAFSADGRHGIAAGKDELWRTDDAGATWTRLPWQGAIYDLRRVGLVDPDGARAYAVVDRLIDQTFTSDLLRSDDGGRTWLQQSLPLPGTVASEYGSLSATEFDPSGRNGWIVGADRLLLTRDGGTTWQLFADLRDYQRVETARWHFELPSLGTAFGTSFVRSLSTTPLAIAFWGPDETWCIARWKLFCIPPGNKSAKSAGVEIDAGADVLVAAVAVAPDRKHAWAVGTHGTILGTDDGGRRWTAQDSGTRGTLLGVFFLPDALHGWAWGEDGLLMTRDGGRHWELVRGR